MITLIYALRDGHWIRYVGKTCNSLEYRLSKHLYYARAGENTYKGRGIRKMLREGRLPRITLLEVVEGNGKKEENDQIAYFRSYGIKLWNSTEGGEGNCLVASVRRKIGKANEGRIHNEVSRKNMSDGHIGQVAWNKNKRDIYSEKSLLKMKESHTGVKLPRERVEKSRAGIIRAWTPAKKKKHGSQL